MTLILSGCLLSGLGDRWSPCGPEHYGPEHLHTEDSTADRLCPTDELVADVTINFLQKGGWGHAIGNWGDLL